MAIVRAILTDALIEIGAIAVGETPSAADIQLALRYFQRQLDAWTAERAALNVQKRIGFTLPSGQSTRTIGPSGQVVTSRPTWLDNLTYVNPGSSPEQEVPVALLTADEYAVLNIKELPSALPLQAFYQMDETNGTLFIWPQVTQAVDMYLYFEAGVTIPVTIDDVLLGTAGYQEAFHYQLAERLLGPFAVGDQAVIARVLTQSERSFARMKRPNLDPGLKNVDPAVAANVGGGYNILSDSTSGFSR